MISLQIEVEDLGDGRLMGTAAWIPGETVVADSWEELYWKIVKKKVEHEARRY